MLPFWWPITLRRHAVRIVNWPSGTVATSSCASRFSSFASESCRSASGASSQAFTSSCARGLSYQPNHPLAPGPYTSEDTAGFR